MNKPHVSVLLWFAPALLVARIMTAQSPDVPDKVRQSENIEHGRAILEGKGGCLACHRVADQGSHLGPDLSSIGADHTPAEIRKELLSPRLVVEPRYQWYQVTTSTGQTFTGRLMNQDRTSIQLLDSTDRLRSFLKENLFHYGFISTPEMPSYRTTLTRDEQSDLIAYLMSLKGIVRE
jgi:putative heme-binding domain-containing protein